MFSVLFVCTGNTCRSPMAEWISKKYMEEFGLTGQVEVTSAGVAAWAGSALSAGASRALARRQIEERGVHAARRFNADMLDQADLVLAMTASQRHSLAREYPQYQHKIHTLSAYALGVEEDIADPYGGDDFSYEAAARQIDEACRGLLRKLRAKLGNA